MIGAEGPLGRVPAAQRACAPPPANWSNLSAHLRGGKVVPLADPSTVTGDRGLGPVPEGGLRDRCRTSRAHSGAALPCDSPSGSRTAPHRSSSELIRVSPSQVSYSSAVHPRLVTRLS